MKYKHIVIATVIFLMITGNSLAQNSNQSVNDKKMETTEKNKAVVRNLIEEILSSKKPELLKNVIADEYVAPNGNKGPGSFFDPVKPLFSAFPDIEWKILDIIGEGDKVMVRWKWTGTHKAKFNQHEATGKTVTNDGMALFVLKNAKITATSILTDRLGFLQQIGAVPVN